ncbi:MAG: pyridoxamine 5'-phosphate oxidase family protein, partial [Rickettsiales bacterium]|nr:pyridoxamine 5'-phosphate oxidase family protein [Rickettsiales bacterium]
MTKKEVLAFMDARHVLMLTTMDGGAPETRALINIRNPEIAPHLAEYFKAHGRMFLMTNTHTDKIAQIRKNPAAALYGFDDNFSGLLLKGKIVEITDAATIDALWDDSWKMYYPDGKDGGDFSLLEFLPESFKFFNGNGNGFVKTAG